MTLRESKTKPEAVLISDIHYNIQTLPLADAAVNMAITKANQLGVPLIVCGDLHDTKANLRGECVNAMLETFSRAIRKPYILVGNHSRLNERAPAHALNFLQDLAIIVDQPMDMPLTGCHGIPYYHDPEELRAYLKTLPKNSRLIMHQGVEDSYSGEYIKDKSALSREDFKDFRVISGHYHRRQDIKCGPPRQGAVGLFSYVGNPFTLNFAEAHDPEKGFQILMSDGTLEFVPTNLRKHIIWNMRTDAFTLGQVVNSGDLLSIKMWGPKAELIKFSRQRLSEAYNLAEGFRLDLIPTDKETTSVKAESKKPSELLDQVIDDLNVPTQAARIKALWKGL